MKENTKWTPPRFILIQWSNLCLVICFSLLLRLNLIYYDSVFFVFKVGVQLLLLLPDHMLLNRQTTYIKLLNIVRRNEQNSDNHRNI
jgi:hypothetical protein